MSDLIEVASTDEVPENEGRVLQVGNREVALFNVAGAFYALENTCCHRGGPLGDGHVKGNSVTCPWHMWEFELATGACVNSPGDRVRTYDVVVQDGAVLIRL